MLTNKRILLGISGGIAAYKTPDLVRKLKAEGADVRVVLTHSGKEFVSPLALQAVSGHEPAHALLDPKAEAAMGHIELAKWADCILIAPATANLMAKLTHGLADDLLSTLCLASSAPLVLAPAMNQQMWQAPVTQQNYQQLKARSVVFLGPDQGEQACGDVGPGRMLEPLDIVQQLKSYLSPQAKPLAGKHVIITAGPTREAIDPVRYISNHSSGKMGYALAHAATELGATVHLVSGPTNLEQPAVSKVTQINSASEMLEAVMTNVSDCDVFIGCAAVADYRHDKIVTQKIKKNDDKLTLTLVKNPDILATVAELEHPPFTLGFAAETQNIAEYAMGKLQRKKLNMIAANDVSDSKIGFNSDQNALTLFWSGGQMSLPQTDKQQLAYQLLNVVAQHLEKE